MFIQFSHLQIHFGGVSSCKGQINTPLVHNGVLQSGIDYPVKMQRRLSQHKMLSRQQAFFIFVTCAVCCICKVFVCLLGSQLTSFRLKLFTAGFSLFVMTCVWKTSFTVLYCTVQQVPWQQPSCSTLSHVGPHGDKTTASGQNPNIAAEPTGTVFPLEQIMTAVALPPSQTCHVVPPLH